jgi:uncharacterized membrane protein YraQ (UPF0718 family)
MGYVSQYFSALATLIGDLWVWFLVGFLAAGAVAEFVPRSFIARHFGSNDFSSLVKAALSGLVASTCSCGAIPMAVSLREKGASTAVALTFLLATPWSGIPQFLVLSNFLGVANTALLMVCAVIAALLSGLVLSRLEKHKVIDEPRVSTGRTGDACTSDDCNDCATDHVQTPRSRMAGVLRHAWDNFRDLGKYLIIGLALAAAVAAFVPTPTVQRFLGATETPWSILIAVPISAIIELCSEGFSVFAGQLYTMGASLGVVFVMLMVGVTTDITEITVVWGKFGRRSALAYVIVSTIIAVGVAYTINVISL